jgi:ferritin-like metal-binding protein YciE
MAAVLLLSVLAAEPVLGSPQREPHMSRDRLIAWLNDAHAMEHGLIQILETHARRSRDVPEISARAAEHADETRAQADRIRKCLELLGTTPSTVKSTFSTIIGAVEGASTAMFTDELMKNLLADYASEHFEIAAYTALIRAAEEAGESEVVALLEENLREEEQMAQWLFDRIPEVVLHTLNLPTATGRRN